VCGTVVCFQEQRTADEMRLRREESDCMRARGEQAAERENSLAAQTKRYGDILKHVLPRMPSDPGEIVNFFGTCENLWELYDDPNGLRAKLLLPLLTAKAKLLINRLMLLAMFSRSKTFCSVRLDSLVASIKPASTLLHAHLMRHMLYSPVGSRTSGDFT